MHTADEFTSTGICAQPGREKYTERDTTTLIGGGDEIHLCIPAALPVCWIVRPGVYSPAASTITCDNWVRGTLHFFQMKMNMQQSIAPKTLLTVPALLAKRRRADRLLALVVYVGAVSVSLLLALLGVKYGFSSVLGIMVVLSALLLISRWPVAGFFVVACCTLAIDQEPLVLNGTPINLYVFYWPPRYTGLIERPVGFLLIFIFFVLICHRFASRQRLLQGGKLLLPFLLFLLCVAIAVSHGMLSGGNFKIFALEIGPFVYLFEAYLLGYNLVSHKKHIRAFLLIVILAPRLQSF